MKNLIAALEMAAAGWHVLPIDPESKRPRVGKGGYHLATTDTDQIVAWWSAHPDDGIAVACRPSGLVAVDIDPRNGGEETFAALETELGHLPPIAVQRSKSGGRHFVFADPSPGAGGWTARHDEGGTVKGQLGQGIDLKCNGYILVEPSPGYRWETPRPWARALPTMPATWQAHARHADQPLALGGGFENWERPSHPGPFLDAEALRAALALLKRGRGERSTFRAVVAIFHDFGLSVVEGKPFLEEWNIGCGMPMESGELARQVRRIASRPLEGLRGARRSDADPLDVIMGARTAPERTLTEADLAAEDCLGDGLHVDEVDVGPDELEEPADPNSWEALYRAALGGIQRELGEKTKLVALPSPLFEDWATFADRAWPLDNWAVTGLLPAEGIHFMIAQPKLGKSWLMTYLGICVAAGKPALGHTVPARRRVWYYYAEDGGRAIQGRVAAICAGMGLASRELVGWLQLQPRGEFMNVASDADLARVIASVKRAAHASGKPETIGDLLVLDPFRDIHGADENDNTEMSSVMRRLRYVQTALGCTVVVPSHPKKGQVTTNIVEALRGAGAVSAAADGFMLITGEANSSSCLMTVSTLIKQAKGADSFSAKRVIEDDAFGRAVKATFEIAQREDEKPDHLLEESLVELLEKIWWHNEERGEGMSTRDALKAIGHGKAHGYEVLMVAETRGLVTRGEARKGGARGLKLTAKGRAETAPLVKGVKS